MRHSWHLSAPFVAPIRITPFQVGVIHVTYLASFVSPIGVKMGTFQRHLWHLRRHLCHLRRHLCHLSHRCGTPQSRINTGFVALRKNRCKQSLKTVYIKRLNSFFCKKQEHKSLDFETSSNLCVQISWHFYFTGYPLRYGRTVLLKRR